MALRAQSTAGPMSESDRTRNDLICPSLFRALLSVWLSLFMRLETRNLESN